jgi:hypothetical protein
VSVVDVVVGATESVAAGAVCVVGSEAVLVLLSIGGVGGWTTGRGRGRGV